MILPDFLAGKTFPIWGLESSFPENAVVAGKNGAIAIVTML